MQGFIAGCMVGLMVACGSLGFLVETYRVPKELQMNNDAWCKSLGYTEWRKTMCVTVEVTKQKQY